MENWLNHEEGLKLVASHYETGAPMPKELIEKIKSSQKFLAASASLRQAQLALLDMAWHHEGPLSTNPELKVDEKTNVELFETLTLKPFQTLEKFLEQVFLQVLDTYLEVDILRATIRTSGLRFWMRMPLSIFKKRASITEKLPINFVAKF